MRQVGVVQQVAGMRAVGVLALGGTGQGIGRGVYLEFS